MVFFFFFMRRYCARICAAAAAKGVAHNYRIRRAYDLVIYASEETFCFDDAPARTQCEYRLELSRESA